MKFKFTWGTGIFITIIIFVSFFLSFIFFSLTQDINLVTKDYFPDEIAYDKKLNKIKNTNLLKEKIYLKKESEQITIFFPDFENISGKISLYYVTSFRQDKLINILTDKENKQIINTKNLKKGRYYIKIDWQSNNKKYFQEFKITI